MWLRIYEAFVDVWRIKPLLRQRTFLEKMKTMVKTGSPILEEAEV
jgi:hypothetical protein